MKRISFLSKFILLNLLTGGLAMGNASAKSGVKETAYQYSFTNMGGESLPLKTYQGKVLLIVNTASQCGFTPQYKELEALYERYQKQGLVVLGVPSGDFGGQEFKHDKEVVAFTKEKFSVTFPLTTINHVKGFQAHPFYQWAKKKIRIYWLAQMEFP